MGVTDMALQYRIGQCSTVSYRTGTIINSGTNTTLILMALSALRAFNTQPDNVEHSIVNFLQKGHWISGTVAGAPGRLACTREEGGMSRGSQMKVDTHMYG